MQKWPQPRGRPRPRRSRRRSEGRAVHTFRQFLTSVGCRETRVPGGPENPTGRVCRRRCGTGASATGYMLAGLLGRAPHSRHRRRAFPPVSDLGESTRSCATRRTTKGSPGWSTLRSAARESWCAESPYSARSVMFFAPRSSCGTATRTAGKCWPSEQEGVKLAHGGRPRSEHVSCRSKRSDLVWRSHWDSAPC